MGKKKGTKSGSKNNSTRNNSGGGGGGGSSSRNNRNRNANRNAEPRTGQNRDRSRPEAPPVPKLSVPEIIQSQQETAITNFSSSELTYNGIASDYKAGYEVEEIVTELGNPETGVKKLREIMNFPSMSCDAGLDDSVLSFQHAILPLLGLFTRTAITECILEKYVLAIFTVIYENLDSFIYDKVMKMLETLVQRNSVCDYNVSDNQLLSRERYSFIPSSLGIFFLIIVRLLTVLLRRISNSSVNETMHNIANDLYRLKDAYQQSLEQQLFSSTDPLTNNLETRKFFFMILEKEMKTMDKMLNNGRNSLMFDQNPEAKKLNVKLDQLYYKELSRRVDAEKTYDPPGELSKYGKRHDNDFSEISKISIIPTNDEVLCERSPFLPTSHRYSLHFLPNGAARLLDTQFRLLREDLLNPIRGGLSNLLTALLQERSSNSDVKLSKELKKVQDLGGRFSYNDGSNENSDLQVYTNVQFANITSGLRKGFACTLRFTPPRISAKGVKGRREFWERSKRLLNNSLVAVILPNPNPQKTDPDTTSISNSDLYLLYFGVVVTRDEKALSKDENFAEIEVNFIDPSIYSIALEDISNFNKSKKTSSKNRFMVESTGVYLESYYHVLKTLQTTNPSSLPFEKYLAPNFSDLNSMNNDVEDVKGKMREEMREEMSSAYDIKVDNPMYTRAPGFQFNLSILCKNQYNLYLNVADESTHDGVIKDIVEHSNIGKLPNGNPYGLDETQAKALISSLTREIALVEGPPGTGKTVVGVQIMKVLLAKENRNTKIGPILTICFTNHALDQFLEHLLDENITNIVRLGFRSKSDRVKNLLLDDVYRNRARTRREAYLLAKLYEEIEKIEKDAKKINDSLTKKWLSWDEISSYLRKNKKEFFNKFNNITEQDLPSWVLNINGGGGFQTSKKKKKNKKHPFDEWVKGIDIETIKKRKKLLLKPPKSNEKNDKSRANQNIFELLKNEETNINEPGTSTSNESQIDNEMINWIKNYNEPKTNRPLNELLNDYSIWRMSIAERKKLYDHWRTNIYKGKVGILTKLQKKHEEKCKEVNNIYDEGRRQVLLRSDVIGMTTNGAAKFQNLIRSIGPRIIICEEAGEVLEAHILSALTQETQHLILIGDHNQLRPHIATYSLSMDSTTGKNYQLDKSLFERLVYGDKAVKIEKAQLLTQRRMRSEVSDLIRYTLYPNLIDGDNTKQYDDIRGAQHNVYFIDHRNPEDSTGGEYAMKSLVNRYEIKMVVEMVKYFVRNGYTKPDDIAVLTPYLGQMIKIRDALARSFVVVIDERDQQNINEMEERQEKQGGTNDDNTSVASKKSLNQQVTLRTVDNFQGEEANIIIVSLVRNFSKLPSGYDSIGFLKSTNRSNVLLSRARKGMYLIGNSELMAMKSKDMWSPVINILHERNQVGFGMPIVCNNHSDYKNIITEPDQFEKVSPNGGCNKNCNMLLPCGHKCKFKCHTDNPDHIGVICNEHCLKVHPECDHPCQKLCFDKCGDCEFLIGDIILPGCGHVLKGAKCWQVRAKDSIKCKTLVLKKLLHCEHYKNIYCSETVNTKEKCTEKCRKQLECGHECLSECDKCQKRSKPPKEETNTIPLIERTQHGKCQTTCNRLLFCGHKCTINCHEGEECPPCKMKNNCIVSCIHSSCNKRCLEPCVVCAEKCSWECEHQGRCELSCGVPCYRLPCNERCNKVLECGHNCAGICGESCPSKDFCVNCASEKVKSQVSDMNSNRTFNEIDWNEKRMIVLTCGHVYTMETMDTLMEMRDYYEGSIEEGWTSIKILPTLPMSAKTCPACKTPIKNVKRYGRIINKYILDIQNKKFLLKCDSQFKEINMQIISFEDNLTNKRNELKNVLPKNEPRPMNVVLETHKVVNKKLPEIMPHKYFKKIGEFHGFDKKSRKAWDAHVGKLLECYQKLTSISEATKVSPHKRAFEVTASSLYQVKLKNEDSILEDHSSVSSPSVRNTLSSISETHQEMLSQVGISIPQMDQRIYLDAFFEIINIQKILHQEILFIIQELSKEPTPTDVTIENTINIKEVWKKFIEKLQHSIQVHLNAIGEIAVFINYDRYLLLVNVEILEFDLKLLTYQLRFPSDESVDVDIKELQERIREKCEDIKKRITNIIESQRYKDSEEEFKNDVHARLVNLLENCNEIENYDVNLNNTLNIEGIFKI
ncbi:hypothetical protein RclHR1_02350015 [Rhizophagus clarus]|uniref:NF-X1-type domain-containing protein n=1 Tax=Rhizophagus clarus TaxID=94130 RepID=A0A2Z6RQE8_9GLOM|nr:hypothetical protein RclHR1_02350015 [Rhizophagus clarus]